MSTTNVAPADVLLPTSRRRIAPLPGFSTDIGIVTWYQVFAATVPVVRYGFSVVHTGVVAASSSSTATCSDAMPACTLAPALKANESSVWPSPANAAVVGSTVAASAAPAAPSVTESACVPSLFGLATRAVVAPDPVNGEAQSSPKTLDVRAGGRGSTIQLAPVGVESAALVVPSSPSSSVSGAQWSALVPTMSPKVEYRASARSETDRIVLSYRIRAGCDSDACAARVGGKLRRQRSAKLADSRARSHEMTTFRHPTRCVATRANGVGPRRCSVPPGSKSTNPELKPSSIWMRTPMGDIPSCRWSPPSSTASPSTSRIPRGDFRRRRCVPSSTSS